MKASALIPEDDLLLKASIEAGASLEALAKGNKRIPIKRKGGSICIHYCRKRRRIRSESYNSSDLSFFGKCKRLQDHATLNHEACVGDVMLGDCLANNFGSITTTDLVDKSAHGCNESITNDYINGSMREDGLCKFTKNVCFLLRDNLMSFFYSDIEPKNDTHMHDEGDLDNSSAATEVEYASLPDSLLSFSDKDYIVCSLNTEDTLDDIPDLLLSFSDKDYIVCSLNTEDTVDNIPDSQLLDSPENVLEDPSFHGDQQDVCHCEDDEESTSISHLNPVHLSEGKITCILNTEDPEIPCNDNIFLLIRPSIDPASSFIHSHMDGLTLSSEHDYTNPHVGHTLKSVSLDHNNCDSDSDLSCFPDVEDPEILCNDNIFSLIHQSPVRHRTSPDSIDPASSFTQSQMDGPGLSSEFDSANPHVGCTLISVSMEHNSSISDHNNSDSDSDVPCLPYIEDPEIPSVRPQAATDSNDLASCFTQSPMDDPGLSCESDFANPHVGCTRKSVSKDPNPSISDHNSYSDLPCFPDIEDSEIPYPTVRPQTVVDSIDPASCFTQSLMDDKSLSSEFDYANLHVGCTFKSVPMDHDPSISDHNTDSDLPCFLDNEDPEIPSPSVRPQTATYFINPTSSFTQSQMDGPDFSSEFNSAYPHVGNTLDYVSVDHNPSISDYDNSDSDSDLPCFPDIEALILKLDYEYAQDSWITNEVKRGKYKHYNRSISRLEQSLSQRAMTAMSSLSAFAVFYSHHFNYYIKKTEVIVGRSTDDTEVDIDLNKESYANMISRQQATIKMEPDGSFTLKNIGRGSILLNGKSIAHGQVAALDSSCLIQIRRMNFSFEINDRYVRWYLDSIMKKTQGKFTTFEWSVN